MTDHTAIIERAVTVYVSTLNSQPEDQRNALVAMNAALTASGLLEVLEKVEGVASTMREIISDPHWRTNDNTLYPRAIQAGRDFDALRNAIKGVRDGK